MQDGEDGGKGGVRLGLSGGENGKEPREKIWLDYGLSYKYVQSNAHT